MVSSRRRWTDDQLIQAVKDSINFTEVVVALGLSARPGNLRTVKKYIGLLSLDTAHFTGKRRNPCSNGPRRTLDEILVEGSTYTTFNLKVRLFQEGLKQKKCENCGLSEWLGQPIALELDHINGVSNDHRIENLRILCPNCHALTPTWRGRNIKKSDPIQYYCSCGAVMERRSKQCRSCFLAIDRHAIEWPPVAEVVELVKKVGYVKAGKALNVSDNGLRKFLTRNSIDTKALKKVRS